ncbi:DUF6624 domain-containing protein [Rhizosphaericola mali]|uniref:Uncharacterized protein n=1 Tax=Rhizosphaericola mali TaxID=2545455 RepID=A0A5P2FVA3_9BACT|nr:DUF6624 domain-containing protein [Rhizosphaericola mali]QES87414.1 hypothetical protein E0W69_001630 [Rhizosphaericola mali]
MKNIFLVFLSILLIKNGYSQANVDSTSAEVNRRLHIIGKDDQHLRFSLLKKKSNDSLLKQINKVDSINENYVLQLLENNGWNKYELDESSNHVIFLVLDHMNKKDVAIMEQYAPLMKEKADAGKLDKSDYATFFDRICKYKNEPQYYGTQFVKIGKDQYVWPINDVENVDKRRASVDLPDMESYIGLVKSMAKKTVVFNKKMTIDEILALQKANEAKN